MKNANVANIRCNVDGLFEHWVALTQPLHKLTDAEANILLAFLRKRHIYACNVKSAEIVDKLLFSTDTRKEIMNSIGYKIGTFQNYLTSMRNKGVILENRINPKLLPNYEDGADNFKLIYNFMIKNG
jgi:hypothetical protein